MPCALLNFSGTMSPLLFLKMRNMVEIIVFGGFPPLENTAMLQGQECCIVSLVTCSSINFR